MTSAGRRDRRPSTIAGRERQTGTRTRVGAPACIAPMAEDDLDAPDLPVIKLGGGADISGKMNGQVEAAAIPSVPTAESALHRRARPSAPILDAKASAHSAKRLRPRSVTLAQPTPLSNGPAEVLVPRTHSRPKTLVRSKPHFRDRMQILESKSPSPSFEPSTRATSAPQQKQHQTPARQTRRPFDIGRNAVACTRSTVTSAR
jgi:hypothetical protein